MYENVKYKHTYFYILYKIAILQKHVYHQFLNKIKANHLNKFCAKF